MKKRLIAISLLSGVLMTMPSLAQNVGSIQRLDPALAKIVPAKAAIQKVAGEFKFTEGPIWLKPGYLLFADIPNNRIMKWVPGPNGSLPGTVSVYMHPSGYLGKKPYTGPESGSNGMTLDKEGRLTVAGHARRCVYRVEKDGSITVLAARYHGKRLNSPNDLVYASDGSLYFTDPPYGLPTQKETDRLKELPFAGVYRIPRAFDQKPGSPPNDAKLELLVKDLLRPNGIAFSPDGKFLYVDNSEPQELYMRYEVMPDGTLAHGKIFYDVTSAPETGNPDGMKVDVEGNVYATGPGGVWIFSPHGKHLGTIKPPEIPANCNWGGADGKTLYMTARTGLYRIHLLIPGIRPE